MNSKLKLLYLKKKLNHDMEKRPDLPDYVFSALKVKYGSELNASQLWELRIKLDQALASYIIDESKELAAVSFNENGIPAIIETIGLELVEEVKKLKS